jgi:hypothetical protein
VINILIQGLLYFENIYLAGQGYKSEGQLSANDFWRNFDTKSVSDIFGEA